MPDLSSVTTNFYATSKEGFSTTTSSTVLSGAVTVPLNSTSGYVDGDVVSLTIDPASASTKQIFTGTVSGLNIINVKWTEGTNQDHAAGSLVVDYVSATHQALQTKGNLVHANADGTLKSSAVTSTALADNSVTTAKILNSNVTPDKLATGAAKAYVATGESTSSTTYTDLTTTTDTVTVTVGVNGVALVSVFAYGNNNSNNAISYLSFAVSGATTISAGVGASGTPDILVQQPSGQNGNNYTYSATILVTGLTPGSTTFKMKYKVSGGTGLFNQRYISVVPL